jgi:hypothetical protein
LFGTVGLLCCGDHLLNALSFTYTSQVKLVLLMLSYFILLIVVVYLAFFIFFCIDSCIIYLYLVQLYKVILLYQVVESCKVSFVICL